MADRGERVIKPGERVLVTGSNGNIGSHVVDLLLSLGYLVRGTCRSDKPWLKSHFDSKYGSGKFEIEVVEKLNDSRALEGAFQDISGVVHVASDVSFNPDPDQVIPYVVGSVESILKAAANGSVKRVVLTSSSIAAAFPQPGVEGVVFTEDSWNEAAIKAAYDKSTPIDAKGFMVYAASKTESERAAWNWVAANSPNFVVNAVLPNFTIGQVLHPEVSSSTMAWTSKLLDGNGDIMNTTPPQYFVDVTDVAKLHAIGLLDPNVRSERIFAFASPFIWADVINILRELRPGCEKLLEPPLDELEDQSKIPPSIRAKHLLHSFFGQPDWVGLKSSLEAGIASLNC